MRRVSAQEGPSVMSRMASVMSTPCYAICRNTTITISKILLRCLLNDHQRLIAGSLLRSYAALGGRDQARSISTDNPCARMELMHTITEEGL